MNERVMQIRKAKGLSRAAFGEEIGVSGDVINNVERGRVELKELLLKHMCEHYRVNEEWLRYGTGEMFKPAEPDEELEEWIGQLQFGAVKGNRSDLMKRQLLLALKHVKHEETWEDLFQIMEEIVNGKTE